MSIRVVADRYELIEPIGSGPIGEVWRGRDRSLDRPVAIKVVRSALCREEPVARRIHDAARRATVLAHPNVVTVYDAWFDGPQLYVAEELVEGVSLTSLLDDGPLPAARTARIARAVLAGLAHAHDEHIVHGDLRPSNVLLAGAERVKVADFALAQAAADAGGGTGLARDLAYLAPETLAGEAAGPAADLYAVGCVLYECLTGRPPSPVSAPGRRSGRPVRVRDRRADIGPGFDRIVMRAISEDPADRFGSARRMDAAIAELALDHFQDTPPAVVAHRHEVVERVTEDLDDTTRPWWLWPPPVVWALLGAIVATLIALAVVAATDDPELPPASVPPPTPLVVTPAPANQFVPVPPPVVERPQPTPIVVTPVPTAPADPTSADATAPP